MDNKLAKGIFEWKSILKENLKHDEERVENKQSELRLMCVQFEIFKDAHDELPEAERSRFYKTYIESMERSIERTENEFNELKKEHRLLSNSINAVLESIESKYPNLDISDPFEEKPLDTSSVIL
ncbi:hypothetical protein [Paenibacillus sp. NAIST15-1]|uniref:hypothetical protein n=1 Tax=Paenibacillus sp. NAIST15-1 TaxID=1605994 RepID=UPI000868ECD1|nr:hypothetical protein [Paenibacillus sp. NAIST15-1]GAV13247.1 hypothetical protein PBN151_3181 [Paenibacillus sp. NAIST15-1]